MATGKCGSCFRSGQCSLKALAELSLPWVASALRFHGTDWDRAHKVQRALRGSGGSPGFTEDWELAGALDPRDIPRLVESLVERDRVTLADLCQPCRHYQGPRFSGEDLADKAA